MTILTSTRRVLHRIVCRLAPQPLIALYLSLRWKAYVSTQARISSPERLRLGDGAYLGKCTIVCTGDIVLGKGAYIHDGVILDATGGTIRIGDRTVINPYCVLYGAGGLDVGQDVGIATHTVMIPANHGYTDMQIPIMKQPINKKGIRIADNVWIAAHCVILDGVQIGEGAIIAAGAVVTRDVAPEVIVAGVPARVLKHRRASRVPEEGPCLSL